MEALLNFIPKSLANIAIRPLSQAWLIWFVLLSSIPLHGNTWVQKVDQWAENWASPVENPSFNFGLHRWGPVQKIKGLIDNSHSDIGKQFVNSAQWIDRYFALDQGLHHHNQSFFRITTAVQALQSEGLQPLFQVKAKVHLPHFKKRFKLIIDSATDSLLQNDEGGQNRLEQGQTQDGEDFSFTTALRWSLFSSLRQHWVIDSGVKLKSPLQAFVRTEYSYQKSLNRNWTFDFNQKLFGFINNESGGSTTFDFSKLISASRLFKVHQRLHLSDESEELELTHGYILHQTISPKKNLSLGCFVYGHTDPELEHTNWLISTEYRQNIFRPWLFFYATPSISYPRSEHWKPQHQLTLGLETFFGRFQR